MSTMYVRATPLVQVYHISPTPPSANQRLKMSSLPSYLASQHDTKVIMIGRATCVSSSPTRKRNKASTYDRGKTRHKSRQRSSATLILRHSPTTKGGGGWSGGGNAIASNQIIRVPTCQNRAQEWVSVDHHRLRTSPSLPPSPPSP